MYRTAVKPSVKQQAFRNGKEECVRDCACRRVSERNRRKAAALGAEITQEGCPAPLKSAVPRTFIKFWEQAQRGEKTFSTR